MHVGHAPVKARPDVGNMEYWIAAITLHNADLIVEKTFISWNH